jgi:hypothetical protein
VELIRFFLFCCWVSRVDMRFARQFRDDIGLGQEDGTDVERWRRLAFREKPQPDGAAAKVRAARGVVNPLRK